MKPRTRILLWARRAVAGGYGARIVDGVVGPEEGDVLVRETVERLKEMWQRKEE